MSNWVSFKIHFKVHYRHISGVSTITCLKSQTCLKMCNVFPIVSCSSRCKQVHSSAFIPPRGTHQSRLCLPFSISCLALVPAVLPAEGGGDCLPLWHSLTAANCVPVKYRLNIFTEHLHNNSPLTPKKSPPRTTLINLVSGLAAAAVG